jgi:T4 bacteriophage base plate protein
MDTTSTNPLFGHFRQPAIYFELPSKGKYWAPGSLELPLNGQIPVYPMTARDEVILRTPDALLNGQGVVDVIQSCCPNIRDAWKMPSIDVDPIIIAIRIASYGNDMDVNSTCVHCEHENEHTLNLGFLTSKITTPDYSEFEINDLWFKLKPQSYFEQNRQNMINFEEEKIMRVVNDSDMTDEEKTEKFNQHLNKLVEINMRILAASTEYIRLPDGMQITNQDYITEYYVNAPANVIKELRNQIEKIAESSNFTRFEVNCEECEKPYRVNLNFDYSSFFAQGS